MRLRQMEFKLVSDFVKRSASAIGKRDRRKARSTILRRIKRASPRDRLGIYAGMARWLNDFNAHVATMRGKLAQQQHAERMAMQAKIARI